MKMENLDLFKDLMEQARVKAQCDAEDRRNGETDDDVDDMARFVSELIMSNGVVNGLDVHITENHAKDGIAVKQKGSAVALAMATCAMVDSFFSTMKKNVLEGHSVDGAELVVHYAVKVLLSHLADDLKEFNEIARKG